MREKVAVPPGPKHCPRCNEVKPHSEWEPKKATHLGRTGQLLPFVPGGSRPS